MDNVTLVDRSERRHQALAALVEYRRVADTKDAVIREAVDAGVTKTVIAKIIGVSRQHLYVMLARNSNAPAEDRAADQPGRA